MHPILLEIGPLTIYSYGVMVALGFVLAAFLIYNRTRRAPVFGVSNGKVIDITLVMLLSGIAGARILYILCNLHYYIANPLEAVNLSKGGLIWYGGFFMAFAVLWRYSKKNGISLWSITDLFVPYVALAQALGRIGCFLNGCCYGTKYPAQLISSLSLVIIFALLRALQGRRRFAGEVLLAYCILYSAKRFLVEFLRSDNPRMAFGLTMSQDISVAIFIVSLAIFLYKGMEWRKKFSNSK